MWQTKAGIAKLLLLPFICLAFQSDNLNYYLEFWILFSSNSFNFKVFLFPVLL